jgi:small subunit ribosomal protein S5
VLAVVGNGEGSAGFGMGKDLEATSALYKATQAARKNMVYVERFDGRTLFHEMEERFAANKLVISLRKANSGTRCNWTLWKILSAFGISDVSIKVHGSRNKMGMTHALFNALQRMQTAQSTADRRGLRVLDMTPRSPAGKAGVAADI